MNNKIFKNLILFSCIVILLLFSNSTNVHSTTNDEVHFNVSSNYELQKAIEQSNDNDVIGISNSIAIDGTITIDTYGKHLTFKRMNDEAHFYFTNITFEFKNITFDGSNIKSRYSF